MRLNILDGISKVKLLFKKKSILGTILSSDNNSQSFVMVPGDLS